MSQLSCGHSPGHGLSDVPCPPKITGTTSVNKVAAPQIQIHTYSHLFHSQQIHFQLTILKDSVFIWVGSEGNEILGDLAIIMPPLLRNKGSTGTTILKSDVEELSKQFGQKLATKFNKQFFVSINLPPNAEEITFAEKKVIDILKEFFS
ncbi:7393_t:CDS:2 [Funneliformis geosporum]|uniref:15585_t:CDS:1 n=1 Tax=Funneliformis geosporum TaxID=1117311 RepID=A0A9W4S9K2_9GLOM|nr:15585_t:CDS:2 [Funneliformis geosporum]CAI2164959.1 7393_t:CDS:2 [Funneliformis geosporum]